MRLCPGGTDGEEVIFLTGLFKSEQVIAECLLALRHDRLLWGEIDAAKAIPWVERRTGVALSPSQFHALTLAVASKVCVVTGGPGAGKTTLVKSVLKVLAAKGTQIALAAQTAVRPSARRSPPASMP